MRLEGRVSGEGDEGVGRGLHGGLPVVVAEVADLHPAVHRTRRNQVHLVAPVGEEKVAHRHEPAGRLPLHDDRVGLLEVSSSQCC